MTDTTEASAEQQKEARAVAAGLRELADFIEANPEFAELLNGDELTMYVPSWHDGAEARFADVARKLGGKRRKDADTKYFHVTRQFGAVGVRIFTDRNVVCTKKVVGTRKVEKPDPNAPKVEVVEEIVEWECGPLLAGAVEQ